MVFSVSCESSYMRLWVCLSGDGAVQGLIAGTSRCGLRWTRVRRWLFGSF